MDKDYNDFVLRMGSFDMEIDLDDDESGNENKNVKRMVHALNGYSNELYHFGVKGMKWGVRRYQNEDGSLTKAGSKRYARDARERDYNEYDPTNSSYYKTSGKNGGKKSYLKVNADRYVKEDMRRAKNLVDSTKKINDSIKVANQNSLDRAAKKHKEKRMNLSSMSDKELRDKINRELLERQYNDVFNKKKVSRGRRFATDVIDISGTVLTVTSSALGIALAIKELRG